MRREGRRSAGPAPALRPGRTSTPAGPIAASARRRRHRGVAPSSNRGLSTLRPQSGTAEEHLGDHQPGGEVQGRGDRDGRHDPLPHPSQKRSSCPGSRTRRGAVPIRWRARRGGRPCPKCRWGPPAHPAADGAVQSPPMSTSSLLTALLQASISRFNRTPIIAAPLIVTLAGMPTGSGSARNTRTHWPASNRSAPWLHLHRFTPPTDVRG
jgi:hypothetical protein